LLLALIASATLAALSNLTDQVDAVFSLVGDHLSSLL
jgi:Flp pilus assembly pilin Flp